MLVMSPTEVLRTKKSWIQKTPEICGGQACIRKTRITVWGLANWRRLGLSDAEIMKRTRGLTQEDLDAAWTYCGQKSKEIERAIKENEKA